MRFIYTIIYYLATPFILLRLLWRSRHTKDYRKRWNERFGFITPVAQKSIWVHAVSVGETLAALPLIKALIARYSPEFTIIVTTATPTASALVTERLKTQVIHTYAPFDTPTAVTRFLKRAQVTLCIIMETELWPNLLMICKKQKIKMMLANARLSEKSFLRYLRIKKLMRLMLTAYDVVAAQGVLDGERFLQLGLDPKKLMITGNIKFDLHIPDAIVAKGKALRAEIGETTPVLIAASTHDGEESLILDAFQKMREKIPNLFLILVPRHPSRAPKVAELCHRKNYSLQLRSQQKPIEKNSAILLVDTIGELTMIYAASDIAFVGGSLVPVGGHNVIEPATLGIPIITGPHLQNFTEIAQLLQHAGALQIVADENQLSDTVTALFISTDLREKIGESAKKAIAENRGALEKHLSQINV
ncbi:MAG: 3-deoxy-D-manno-octulosonic acid transferase [Gammaproteobacteria bacterium RIFCSPLOWO2_02_FULL_42_14]|nr:MAG: 3-deoxy-D-manno-octulosonic acid transferase [Gammaproteobacteria bacterium RIFCSPHIGHO2_02_FULL_42_43]OGT27620.1 MAG: 3-deoxy-D-manno-octulosonic acid transferase [Gammaproteobacteria bacterium RIFCSPHIGHO2_01_FULL_42_8]OGT53144.1 MAG: 3-deoxy-D-manno-octulosonic acid transferase [Gammaproteobacteria bacterium RIFCSPHIGHO2_12_FULL_41_25]OGT60973.1 MAG: 3-deoxy-D-manno-octulosonic acid transferase [Gammaproteobacteria bacterium RIFCSPLOWO2_02_FULL_42_14]OGT85289.1 MAG: 3-deoxy-D-manno-o